MPRTFLLRGSRFWLRCEKQDGCVFVAAETGEIVHFGWREIADLYFAGLLRCDPTERVHPVEGER